MNRIGSYFHLYFSVVTRKTFGECYNSNTLTPEKKKGLSKILHDYIHEFPEEKNKLLETETSKLLNNLYKYNKEKKNDQIINFFKPIIPISDLEALDASLYLREIFKNRGNVEKLKKDIIMRFGTRGKNISNLCTAGYFEEFLMPLYNYSKEDFENVYEIIISKSAMAIFVSKDMSQFEIQNEIRKKLDISKQYGIKFIHIHGIGFKNITKIKKCIEENKKLLEFFDKNIYTNRDKNIIIVELLIV